MMLRDDDGDGVGTFYVPECFSGQFNGASEKMLLISVSLFEIVFADG